MRSDVTRRNFLKTMYALTAGLWVSRQSEAKGVFDRIDTTTAKDQFSLNKFYPSVDSLAVPDIAYRAGQPIDARYSLFSLGYDRFRKEGTVAFSWHEQGHRNLCDCIVERNTKTEGLKHIYHQKSYHNPDLHHTPVEWSWHSRIAEDIQAAPYAFTELHGNARIQEDQLIVSMGRQTVHKQLCGDPLLKWGHWQMLYGVREDADLTFCWIDEMEQVFDRHRIQFMKKAAINVRSRTLSLYAFGHIGAGWVPTVYWRMENGVLMFIVSGTEIYMLDEFNGKRLNYTVPSGPIERNNI